MTSAGAFAWRKGGGNGSKVTELIIWARLYNPVDETMEVGSVIWNN